MSMNITVSLPEELYRRAENFARLTGRALPDVLTDTLAMSLPLLGSDGTPPPPLTDASDDQVIAMTELQMAPDQDQRLSALLDRQQAGLLVAGESIELVELMQVYEDGLLRKAYALAEAVRRGIREPLTP